PTSCARQGARTTGGRLSAARRARCEGAFRASREPRDSARNGDLDVVMTISFDYPATLWLLLLVPLALGLALLGQPRLPRGRRLASLALRGLIMVLLVLAVAGAQIRRPVNQLTVVFLVDASDSISPAAREGATEFIRAALQAMPDGDEAAVVVFGKEALVE